MMNAEAMNAHVAELEAEIDSLRAENEALNVELGRKIEDRRRAEALRDAAERKLERAREALRKIRLEAYAGDARVRMLAERALADTDPAASEPCTWTPDEDGIYHTACGHAFFTDSGTAAENGMAFCCFCGRPIDEVRRHAFLGGGGHIIEHVRRPAREAANDGGGDVDD